MDTIANRLSPESRKKFDKIVAKANQGESTLIKELEVESTFEADVIEAFRSNLRNVEGNKHPSQKEVRSFAYERDPYVVAYALKKANGICHDCKKNGPFVSKATGLPFLEAHHVIMLNDGGSDTIDNVIGLCPNCHRARHYG